MSLKALELQVALPRMTDVGRIQEQELQRPIHEQVAQQEERKQLDELNRQRPIEVEHPEKNMIREREKRGQSHDREEGLRTAAGKEEGSENKKADSVSMRDPFRGRYIDISL